MLSARSYIFKFSILLITQYFTFKFWQTIKSTRINYSKHWIWKNAILNFELKSCLIPFRSILLAYMYIYVDCFFLHMFYHLINHLWITVWIHFLIECPPGYFGMNCMERCSGHCIYNAPCDHVSGVCPSGCQEGYILAFCNNSKTHLVVYSVLLVHHTVCIAYQLTKCAFWWYLLDYGFVRSETNE